jgi:hypothetical protein
MSSSRFMGDSIFLVHIVFLGVERIPDPEGLRGDPREMEKIPHFSNHLKKRLVTLVRPTLIISAFDELYNPDAVYLDHQMLPAL